MDNVATNTARGEIKVTLGGRSFNLKPSFSAMCELEEKCGLECVEIMQRVASRKSIGFRVMAAAFWCGIRAGWKEKADPPTFDEVGEMVQDAGISVIAGTFMEFMDRGMSSTDRLRQKESAAGKLTTEGSPTP